MYTQNNINGYTSFSISFHLPFYFILSFFFADIFNAAIYIRTHHRSVSSSYLAFHILMWMRNGYSRTKICRPLLALHRTYKSVNRIKSCAEFKFFFFLMIMRTSVPKQFKHFISERPSEHEYEIKHWLFAWEQMKIEMREKKTKQNRSKEKKMCKIRMKTIFVCFRSMN